jgi:hypothetical protein
MVGRQASLARKTRLAWRKGMDRLRMKDCRGSEPGMPGWVLDLRRWTP